MVSNEITAPDKVRPLTVRDWLSTDKVRREIAHALPKHLNMDRFVRISLTTIQQTPKLMECDQVSLLKALMESAQLGLEPDGVLGHAYLVPYWNNRKNCLEAKFQIGFKGLMALAYRSDKITKLTSNVVHENDMFEYEYGLTERLTHRPASGDRGKLINAYAIATFSNGEKVFEVMSGEDIERAREFSKAKDSGPWKTHEADMWRKTVLRKICKYLPQNVELQRAAALDEHYDMGIDTAPTYAESKTTEKTNQLRERLKPPFVDAIEAEAENTSPAVNDETIKKISDWAKRINGYTLNEAALRLLTQEEAFAAMGLMNDGAFEAVSFLIKDDGKKK